MPNQLISKKHCAPFALHFDATEPFHPANLRTVQRIAAEAVRNGVAGTVDVDTFEHALLQKAAINHATTHFQGEPDAVSPKDIGAMSPPPGNGKPYLAVGGGWVEYIPPEFDTSGIVIIENHADLKNRDAADQHPQSAIQHLTSDLDSIRADIDDLFDAGGGGIDVWQEDKYYAPPKLLFGRDNNLYKALAESGPGTDVGVRDPVSEPVEYGVDISGITATLPTSTNWISIACGGSVFVVIGYNSNKAAYSTDGGKAWTAATLPSSANWRSVTYGDGVFVVVADGNSGKAAYSIDGGKTWTAVSMSVSADWRSVTYGDGVFVAVDFSGNKVACSTDGGKTWSAATLPSSASWLSITHGGGVFVAVAYNSNKAAYSTDGGKTWTAATLPASAYWRSVTFGDDVFVAVATTGNTVAYSVDGGKTWSIATLPLSADWYSVSYGNGVFVAAIGYSSNKVAYSIDKGKTWIIATLPLSASWRSMAYGDNAFAIVADSLNKSCILNIDATFLPDCWKRVA